MLAGQITAGIAPWPFADDIAKVKDVVDATRFDIGQYRFEGSQIAVGVRKDSDAHASMTSPSNASVTWSGNSGAISLSRPSSWPTWLR